MSDYVVPTALQELFQGPKKATGASSVHFVGFDVYKP